MSKILNIELYVETGINPIYHAYIGEDGSSGYDCAGITPEICAKQVKNCIKTALNDC